MILSTITFNRHINARYCIEKTQGKHTLPVSKKEKTEKQTKYRKYSTFEIKT